MDQISVQNFFSSSKAYFIAVSKYDSPAVTDLQTPYNDVQALSAVLHQLHGFTIETVVYKTDDGFDACMLNPLFNPASGQLLNFLRNLTAGENDRVVIYFACHGIAIDSEGNPEGYMLAADATPGQWDSFIRMSEVLAIVNKLNCKHLFLILDCCYAGAFRWAGTTRGVGSEVPKTIYYEKLKQYTDNKAWQVLTSAAHDQKAIDTLRLGSRETESGSLLSPFAELLVKALQTGDSDLRFGSMEPDGLITATELSYYLQQSIFKNLFEQKIEADKRQLPMLFPVINAAAGLVGKGEFLFQNPAIKNIKLKLKNNTTNPYKGLNAYTKEDNTIFYGRQRVLTGWIDGKTENIGLIPASKQYQLIILTGPSGIGKSSLAKAGLLAYYKDEKKLYDLRPGKTPWSVNEEILTEICKLENAIVLVDQYEELVTVCASEEEREKFEKALLTISQKNVVVVTIRSDFENQFRNSPLLQIKTESDKLMKYRFVVPPFERNELEEIVVQPAMQELLEFKPINNVADAADAFVDSIVDDAFQNPGSLPLLSMSLSELWEKRDNNNLLEQTYYDFGGITGILDRKAKEEYNKLSGDSEGQLLFKQLIFRMVSFEGGRISRRRIYTVLNRKTSNENVTDELILNTPSRTEKIKGIAVNLTNARLIKPDTDESGNAFIEPSHDALLRSWVTLTKWLREKDTLTTQTGQETIVLLRAVADAVSNRVLWASDPRLLVAKKNIGVNLNKCEEQFIRDSVRKKNYNRRIRTWSVSIAAAIITALAIFGWLQAVRSAERAKNTSALLLASESDKYGATEKLAMLREAYSIYKDSSIERKIYDALNTYDYYNPFAADKFSTVDSIVGLYYADTGSSLIVTGTGGLQKRNFVNHSYLPLLENESLNAKFIVSDNSSFTSVKNVINAKHHTFIKKTLIGYNNTHPSFINMVLSDSLFYYCVRLDSNCNYVFNRRLNVPHLYTNIDYFANGYFAVDSLDYHLLFDADGVKIDTRYPPLRVADLIFEGGQVTELLQNTESNDLFIGLPGQNNTLSAVSRNIDYNINHFYTKFDSYALEDSFFLFVITHPPIEGPSGQYSRIYKYDRSTNIMLPLVETNYLFYTFELSADRKTFIATSETDSLYVIHLQQNRVTTTYYSGLEKAGFCGEQNNYFVVNKSAPGYTTTLFDSASTLLNSIDYSAYPELMAISGSNKWISVYYGRGGILTWQLDKPFKAKPWAEILNNETSAGSFVTDNLQVSNFGTFISVNARIESGQNLYPATYINHTLQPGELSEVTEITTNYILLPTQDSLLTCCIDWSNKKLTKLTCTSLSDNKTINISRDSEKQQLIRSLLQQQLPVMVKEGKLLYHTTAGSQIIIDSVDHFIINWGIQYYIYNNQLLNRYDYTDTAFAIYTPSALLTYRDFPDGKSLIRKWETANENTIAQFVYGSGNESRTVREKLKQLTGYDVYDKDSLTPYINEGDIFNYSEQGFLFIHNNMLYISNPEISSGFELMRPANISNATLFENGKEIVLVSTDGTIYLKKTRKYLKWFLENGYTIPLDKKIIAGTVI